MAVERQRSGQLLDQRIDQLLLIVAQMPPGGQRGQQDTVLGMAVRQSPLQCRTAGGEGRQASRAKMTAFVIAGHVGLTGKFLMIIFIFNIVDPQLQVMQQGQILQAIQHRREAFT